MMEYKRLGQHDLPIFKKLIRIFNEVFENENPVNANEQYLTTLLSNPGFICFVAIVSNEVAGGLTAYELPLYYSDQSEVFIYDLAFKSEFQRKGLGKNIILVLSEYCRQNRIKEMFVAAHEKDKHAVDFYHSAGGKAEKVVHFNFSTKLDD